MKKKHKTNINPDTITLAIRYAHNIINIILHQIDKYDGPKTNEKTLH